MIKIIVKHLAESKSYSVIYRLTMNSSSLFKIFNAEIQQANLSFLSIPSEGGGSNGSYGRQREI